MVSKWRRRMSTSERLPDVLMQEPQVAQALAPPQTPPPVDAEVCMALPVLPACWHDSTSAVSFGLKVMGLLAHNPPGDTGEATCVKLLLGAHVLVYLCRYPGADAAANDIPTRCMVRVASRASACLSRGSGYHGQCWPAVPLRACSLGVDRTHRLPQLHVYAHMWPASLVLPPAACPRPGLLCKQT